MATEIPYMPSVANVGAILDKIGSAGTPPKFTHDFLKTTLGFASSNDRAMVKVLRALGFLNADGTPTPRYNEFKGKPGPALAAGLREGWADLFMADQKIFERAANEVQATAKSVTGTGDSVAQKIASTFKALSDRADWTAPDGDGQTPPPGTGDLPDVPDTNGSPDPPAGAGIASDFKLHHDIHLHLPPTTDVAVYRAIFQAIKAELT